MLFKGTKKPAGAVRGQGQGKGEGEEYVGEKSVSTTKVQGAAVGTTHKVAGRPGCGAVKVPPTRTG